MNTARPTRLQATFDGELIEAEPGQSIAAALLAAGKIAWRTTKHGNPRGLFCGIGICFDCLVEIDGESGQRACMVPLEDGMRVCSAQGAVLPEHNASASQNGKARHPDTHSQNISNEAKGMQ